MPSDQPIGDSMAKQPVQVPGEAEGLTAPASNDQVDPRDAEIAALKAQLAEQKSAAKLPQPVFEPNTPHGSRKLAESEFAHLTTTKLHAEIKAGRVEAPLTGVLCSDGWYSFHIKREG